MEISEAIGFIQFYGNTPAINFLEDESCNSHINPFLKILVLNKEEINIFMSAASDLRHMMKTLFEIVTNEKWKDKKINVTLIFKQSECL